MRMSINQNDNDMFRISYNAYQVQKILHLMGCKAWQINNLISLLFSKAEYINKSTLFEKLSLLLISSHSVNNSSSNVDIIHELLLDAKVACSIHDKQKPIIILLGGTSGCGKSTIASFLSSRFGISSILSTDSVRHILRTKYDRNSAPYLWTSSYQAVDVIFSKSDYNRNTIFDDHKKYVVQGYQLQSSMVIQEIDKIIQWYAQVKKESLIIEGVHLSMEQCTKWMNKYESVIPFMLCIEKETKHMERFAIRAKYMTLEPHINKYIRYFDNIRIIQEHLSDQANILEIPRIDNTNIDRTIAILHQTIFAVLKLHLSHSNTSAILFNEFNKIYAKSMRSKEALSIIRQREARKRSLSETRVLSKQLSSKTDQSSRYQTLDSSRSNSIYDFKNDHRSALLRYLVKEQDLVPFLYNYNDLTIQESSSILDDDEIASLGS